MFFFFACESTEKEPPKREKTTKEKDTDRKRSKPRSSSRGSSGDGNTDGSTDGSTDGEPDGPVVIDTACPSAEEVDDDHLLTTVTFEKEVIDGTCLNGKYSHRAFNRGADDPDDCEQVCSVVDPKGFASPNQNIILSIDSYDPDIDGHKQDINLNESVVGNLRALRDSSDIKFYIYFKRQDEDTTKSELEKTIYRWPTCVCSGQSEATRVTLARIKRGEDKLSETDLCQKNVVKVWLAKETSLTSARSTCKFYKPE